MFLVGVPMHAQSTNLKNLCNISRKKLEIKLIFCMQVNIKVFHKLIMSLLTTVARHAQSPQKTSLQYLRNDMLDYLDFWYVPRAPCNRKSFLDMAIIEYHN